MKPPSKRPTASRTVDQVLDVAERLVQTRGFNAFSYADIAAAVGITKASLHYHFPSKADLGTALIARYTESFGKVLRGIDASGCNAIGKLERYVQLYLGVFEQGRLCLCGMLAAEYSTLPEPMQHGVRGFFDANETWLERALEQGKRAGCLGFHGTAQDAARLLTATVEGAMLLARSYDDASRLAAPAAQAISRLVEPGSRRRRR